MIEQPRDETMSDYMTVLSYLGSYDPVILDYFPGDVAAASFAADEAWMTAKAAALGLALGPIIDGAQTYHKALLGWCFAPARE
jgi:hypothetical protein